MLLLRDAEKRASGAALRDRHITAVRAAHSSSGDLQHLLVDKLVDLLPIAARSVLYADRLRQWRDPDFVERVRRLPSDVVLAKVLRTSCHLPRN